jgi:hypothetical protein
MKHVAAPQRFLIFLLFLFLGFAGCQKKAQGPRHVIKLHAGGKPSKALFDSAVMVLTQRLEVVYHGDITVRAEGKTIVLEVVGRPNLDSLAVLVLSRGGFGMYETYNNNEVATVLPDATLPSLGVPPTPDGAELIFAAASDTNRIRKLYTDRNQSLSDVIFIWGMEDSYQGAYPLYALKRPAAGMPLISKSMVSEAKGDYDGLGRPSVTIRLKEAYFNTWRDMTRDNVGRHIAIRFANQVLSAPKVLSEIEGGNMQISGNFTGLQTRLMAAIITTPDLDAALQINHIDTALFVPLRGYPTLKQQARYEVIQSEFLRLRPQIDSLLAGSGAQVLVARREMERIYRQDINTMAAETKATRADVDEFITNMEGVLNGLKRRLSGEVDETDPESLKRMLEALPTQE